MASAASTIKAARKDIAAAVLATTIRSRHSDARIRRAFRDWAAQQPELNRMKDGRLESYVIPSSNIHSCYLDAALAEVQIVK